MTGFPAGEVRDDFVPKADFLDRRFHELEKENLWPKVWQAACRLEEIPEPGDYATYDIIDDSIVVVRRGPSEVAAYHNACPHRGTQLVDPTENGGKGSIREFLCSFHGWRFGLDGRNVEVVDSHDWGGCLKTGDTDLAPVQAGIWGGWVWINMDPGCQPLMEFLSPMAEMCELFEFDKLRPAWNKSVVVQANWKTVLGAFTEFYHVQTTHAQMLTYTDDYSTSRGMGRHGWISYAASSGLPVSRSPRLPPKEVPDFREYLYEYAEQFTGDLQAMMTGRAYQATQRLRTEVPADAPPGEVLGKWAGFIYEAAIESGAGWPDKLTPEYVAASGFDWHVFPNTAFLHPAIEAVLWYRFRPHGDDHERCLMDVWSFERFAPGAEPDVEHQIFADWRDGDFPLIFRQDFLNIPKVQRGMKSRGFKGGRPSPVQERAVSNFHRALRRFLEDPHADDDLQPEPPVTAPPS
ncbi:MAG TPA: aromatic ring-hydroxylating dioxygenase subunit alpha [Novosphingobium sp.]